MRVLVLGGTAWLGRAIAAAHLRVGHEVTCVARGSGDVPQGARLVRADRDAGASALEGREAIAGEWDEVVDLTSIPAHAATAAEVLATRAAHWTLVSTVSVYADADRPGSDESARLVASSDDPDDYAGAKVRIEETMRAALGDRLLVLRPGLVVGPGDPSDRFGSWAARAALAGDEALLVPPDRATQVVDVRDLAAAIVDLGARRVMGVRNAVGDVTPLHVVVDEMRRATRHAGPVVVATDEELANAGVAPWAGPRSLALWLPAGHDGFGARSNAALLADGVRLRPLAATIRDVVADEADRGLARDRRSGISRGDELRAIAAIRDARVAAGSSAPIRDAERRRTQP